MSSSLLRSLIYGCHALVRSQLKLTSRDALIIIVISIIVVIIISMIISVVVVISIIIVVIIIIIALSCSLAEAGLLNAHNSSQDDDEDLNFKDFMFYIAEKHFA